MRKLLLFILFVFGLFGSKLIDVTVSGSNQKTILNFAFDEKVSYTDFTVDNSIVLDILNTTTDFDQNVWNISKGKINNIEFSYVPSANMLRVTINCAQEFSYLVLQSDNSIVVEINTMTERFEPVSLSKPKETVLEKKEEVKEEIKEEKKYVPLRKTLSLNFENANIETALRAIAEYAGMNIVIGDAVKGVVTVKLDNVYWEDALRLILQTKGYAYVIEGNVIRVGSGKDFEQERESQEMASPLIQKVIKLEFANCEDVVKILKGLLSKRGAIDVDKRTNSVIVKDVDSKMMEIESLVRILDTKTPQVSIEARIIDADKSVVNDLAVSLGTNYMTQPNWNIGGQFQSTQTGAPLGGLGLTLGTIRDFAKLIGTLKALEANNKIHTIANPRITTANNQQAEVFGGKKFSATVIDQRGNPVVTWFTAGIRLTCTPQINSLEDITMNIEIELSDVITEKLITMTNASTRALIRDGETLVIGGFIQQTETERIEGIPILKNLPLIGFLFRRTYKEVRDREVLIFLTPHIIKDIY